VVDGLKVTNPTLFKLASADGPAPTMFETGDLPPFTASGVDVKLAAQLPWQARFAFVAAPSQAEAYRIFETYAMDPDGASLSPEFTASDGARDYVSRVSQWAAGTGPKQVALTPGVKASFASLVTEADEDALMDALFDSPQERQRLADEKRVADGIAKRKLDAQAAKDAKAAAAAAVERNARIADRHYEAAAARRRRGW
jgi:hypothetical protein